MVGSRFTHAAEAKYSPTEGELLGRLNLMVGKNHMPSLGLLADKHLDAIDNTRLVRLEQKTLSWLFTTQYIPGKLLGGTDALSRYSVHHCTEEEIWEQDNSQSTRQHLISLLATSSSITATSSDPLLMDEDTDLISSMSTTVRPVTWQEI